MEKYFKIAIKEAKKALKKNEIPVGAVLVENDKIIAKAHNNRQRKYNILGHAEILCISKATKKIKDWRLDNCELYVTLEPCEMCNGIIRESRIKNVYYLLKKDESNTKNSAQRICANVCSTERKEYEIILKKFFVKLRDKNNN